MVVFLLCVGIVLGTSYVGYSFALYYKKRKLFFSDFIDFLNHSKTQISFLQSRRSNIFSSFGSGDSDFEKITKNLAADKDVKKPAYLKQDEWFYVEHYMKNLGKSDVESECQNIEANLQKAKALLSKCDKECEQKYALCIKLGVAVGIAISIIIV